MKQELENNALVKSLLNMGFSEEYIEKGIACGDIDIEKGKTEEDMKRSGEWEKRNIENDKKHIEDLKKDEKEDKKDEKDLKRDEKEHEDKEDKKDDMKKSVDADLLKSFGQQIVDAIAPAFSLMNQRLDEQAEMMKSIKNQAPAFKSNFSKGAFIEKSIETRKSESGKIAMSQTKDRNALKKVIEKALDNDDFAKSYAEDVKGYLMSDMGTISFGVAKYLYDNANVEVEA